MVSVDGQALHGDFGKLQSLMDGAKAAMTMDFVFGVPGPKGRR